jgi:hypothetical protein
VRLDDGALTSFSPKATVWNISSLVVAGSGVLIGGPEGGGVFDARSGLRLSATAPLSSAASIAVRGRIAYLGGDIRTGIGGHNLLALDRHSGRLTSWRPNLARYVAVGTIAPSGDRAFIGGQFCSTLG